MYELYYIFGKRLNNIQRLYIRHNQVVQNAAMDKLGKKINKF